MIDACRRARVKLMYAEELCFTPKNVRLKLLIDEGALGTVHLVKQCEKHDGPHAAWFWDVQRSGGGVTMDMGCHAIEFFRWLLGGPGGGKASVRSVYADMGTYVHADKTQGDDSSTLILKMEGGATAIAEESWAKPGGMDDRAEIYGSDPRGRFAAVLATAALIAIGGLYYLVFQRRRTGILAEHAAQRLLAAEAIDLEVLGNSSGFITGLAPGD